MDQRDRDVIANMRSTDSDNQNRTIVIDRNPAASNRSECSQKELQSLQKERNKRLKKDKALSLHIRTPKKSRQVLTKWDDTVWTVMVEKAIVHRDKSITFVFYNGNKIRVEA